MNREEAAKFLSIIQALAEGKTVQFKSRIFNDWKDTDNPYFEQNIEYRIKPEPRKVWVVEFGDGSTLSVDKSTFKTSYGEVKKIHGPFELKD